VSDCGLVGEKVRPGRREANIDAARWAAFNSGSVTDMPPAGKCGCESAHFAHVGSK
jgi:hypothetical protein